MVEPGSEAIKWTIYVAVGLVLVLAPLAHSDPLTGRSLYHDLRDQWRRWRSS